MKSKKPLKTLGLVLAATLLFTACNTPPLLPSEEASVVLEKSLLQASKTYEATSDMELQFGEDARGQSGTITLKVSEKSNMEDLDQMQSEGSFEIDADLKMAPPQATDESLETVTLKLAADMKVVGEHLYASLKTLDLGGTLQEVEQVKALIPLFVGPYMDQTVHLSLNTIMQALNPGNEASPDLDQLKRYSEEQMAQDLVDSKVLVVSQDHGVKSLTTPSRKKVNAYHYEVEINPEGLETFLTDLNEELQWTSTEEWNMVLLGSEDQPSLREMVPFINEAITFELWIGQEDYHTYRVVMNTDLEKIQTAMENAALSSERFVPLSEGLNEDFEGVTFSMKLDTQSEPIAPFSVQIPSEDENVIDLDALILSQIQRLEQQMNMAPSNSLSDEEMEALMNSLNEEGFNLEDIESVENLEE